MSSCNIRVWTRNIWTKIEDGIIWERKNQKLLGFTSDRALSVEHHIITTGKQVGS